MDLGAGGSIDMATSGGVISAVPEKMRMEIWILPNLELHCL